MQDGAGAERSHQKEDGEEGWHIHQSAKENGEAYQAERIFFGSTQHRQTDGAKTQTQKGAEGLTQIIKRRTFSFGMPACNHCLAAGFADPLPLS